jgi:hypothetical protein
MGASIRSGSALSRRADELGGCERGGCGSAPSASSGCGCGFPSPLPLEIVIALSSPRKPLLGEWSGAMNHPLGDESTAVAMRR